MYGPSLYFAFAGRLPLGYLVQHCRCSDHANFPVGLCSHEAASVHSIASLWGYGKRILGRSDLRQQHGDVSACASSTTSS